MDKERLLEECRVGWLSVETDLKARLTKPGLLKYALQLMGRNPSDAGIERYWSQCGGSMSFEQFTLVMQREKKTSMSDLMRAFRKIDINNDGYITAEELQRKLTKRGEKMSADEVQAIIAEADQNGDGRLDYAEFCHMLLNTSEECIQAKITQQQKQQGEPNNSNKWRGSKPRRSKSSQANQRRADFDRKEKRREEIRMHLYSPDGKMTSKPDSPKGSEKVLSGVTNLNFVPSSESAISVDPVITSDTVSELNPDKKPDSSLMSNIPRGTSIGSEGTAIQDLKSRSVNGQKILLDPLGLSREDSSELVAAQETKLPPLKRKGSLPPLLLPLSNHGGNVRLDTIAKNSKNKVENQEVNPPSVSVGTGESGHIIVDETNTTKDPGGSEEKSDRREIDEHLTDDAAKSIDEDVTIHSRKAVSDAARSKVKMSDGVHTSPDERSNDSSKENHDVLSSSSETCPPPRRTPPQGDDASPSDNNILEGKHILSEENNSASLGNSSISEENNAPSDGHQNIPPLSVPSDANNAASEGTVPSQQPDHLQQTTSEKEKKENKEVGIETEPGIKTPPMTTTPPPPPPPPCTSVVTTPPRKPKDIKMWNSITGKGCFYLDSYPEPGQDEEGVINCHHYCLKLPSATNVWIEMGVASPGIQETDVLLFIFRTDESENATDFIAYTEHRVDERWICRLDLDAGAYALIPFTSGCHLKPPDEDHPITSTTTTNTTGVSLMETNKDGHTVLTKECVGALEEVYHRIDLDSNGFISRTEFDFFQDVTNGEIPDDDAWDIILSNFDVTREGEITLKGFLALHEMTATDEEGGGEELWEAMESLGYNKQLKLVQACPFLLEVFTEDCEGEIEIIDLLPSAPIVNPAFSQVVVEKGVATPVKGGEESLMSYIFTTPYLTTIAVENKDSVTTYVQLDCSRSVNSICSRESTVHVLEIPAQSLCIGYHIQPSDSQEPHNVHCIASKILA